MAQRTDICQEEGACVGQFRREQRRDLGRVLDYAWQGGDDAGAESDDEEAMLGDRVHGQKLPEYSKHDKRRLTMT
jgi:hypothetical protein